MVERIEDSIASLESKMAAKLDRIEERLDHLEAVSNSPTDVPCEIVSASLYLRNRKQVPCSSFYRISVSMRMSAYAYALEGTSLKA